MLYSCTHMATMGVKGLMFVEESLKRLNRQMKVKVWWCLQLQCRLLGCRSCGFLQDMSTGSEKVSNFDIYKSSLVKNISLQIVRRQHALNDELFIFSLHVVYTPFSTHACRLNVQCQNG